MAGTAGRLNGEQALPVRRIVLRRFAESQLSELSRWQLTNDAQWTEIQVRYILPLVRIIRRRIVTVGAVAGLLIVTAWVLPAWWGLQVAFLVSTLALLAQLARMWIRTPMHTLRQWEAGYAVASHSFAELDRASDQHPELREVVSRWKGSGRPVRMRDLLQVQAYLVARAEAGDPLHESKHHESDRRGESERGGTRPD